MTVECERTFAFSIADSANNQYIDLAQCLSMVNRKLYRQSKCYYISKLQWISGNNLVVPDVGGKYQVAKVTLNTIPYNWVSRNAWVKAYNLWLNMQKRILKNNPSVKGKWRDFKVFFNPDHYTRFYADGNLIPVDAGFVAAKEGEWNMSTLVLPQHDVTQATGIVKDADDFELTMLGDDTKAGDAYVTGGIIKMYEDTRSRQNSEPLVPADYPDSWGIKLVDTGSQDPELAEIVDAENDLPPYDNDDYPGGGGANMDNGVIQTQLQCTMNNQKDTESGFPVPLGLLSVNRALVTDSGGGLLLVTLAPGSYNGVLATEMKQ